MRDDRQRAANHATAVAYGPAMMEGGRAAGVGLLQRKGGPAGAGGRRRDGEDTLDFTDEQIQNAVRRIVRRYGQMLELGQRDVNDVTMERMIQVAAEDLVAEHYLAAELAEIAGPKAVAFNTHGGRW